MDNAKTGLLLVVALFTILHSLIILIIAGQGFFAGGVLGYVVAKHEKQIIETLKQLNRRNPNR